MLAAVGLLAIGAAWGAVPRAQQPAASRVVLASVSDGRNHPLTDLGPDDFLINENGASREVISVYAADYPIIVLVDNSADARSDLEPIRGAVTRFLSRIGQRSVAIGTLANPPAMLTSLEDDRNTLLARLEKLTVSPTTVLMPVEAVAAAAQKVQDLGAPFSAIVVISAHPIDSAPQNTRLLPVIFDSHAVVHVISRSSPATAPRGRAYAPRLEGDLLRDLADQTRGYFTTVFSAASYAVALNALAERLAMEMMVEYLVPPGPLPDGQVQVGVRVPGAHVRGVGVSR
jgi:hypothetical protein